MATLVKKSSTKGNIKTKTETLKYYIKKPFKGSINYTLFIDGKDKGLKGLCVNDVYVQLVEYIKYWN